MTLIDKAEALASIEKALNNATGDLYDAYAAIAALPARGEHGVDAVLDAAHDYLMEQYGYSPLKHPTDRALILAALSPTDAAHARDCCDLCGSDVTDMDGHLVHDDGCNGETYDPAAQAQEAALQELIDAYEDIMDYGIVFAKKPQQDRLNAAKEKLKEAHT